MVDYESMTKDDVIKTIKEISEQSEEEFSKEKIDKEKLFKLRYAQMIQGLYLQNTMK